MAYFLVCGNDKELINDLFCAEENSLPINFVSTTENPADIQRHLKAFSPAGFIFCANNQTEESVIKIDSILDELIFSNIKFIVTATEEELDYLYPRFGARKIYATLPRIVGVKGIFKTISDVMSGASQPAPRSPVTETHSSPESAKNLNQQKNEAHVQIETHESKSVSETKQEVNSPVKSDDSTQQATRKKILVIDDDVNIIRTLKFYLQENYTVAVASSGQVALNFLRENSVDLILLDYMMPIMDGPTVLSKIRKMTEPHVIPVIFLSGLTDREKIKQLISSNVQGYLLKPVDNKKLQDAIKKALGE